MIIPHLQEHQLVKSAFVHAKVYLYWSIVIFHESPERDTLVSFDTKFTDMSRERGTTTYLRNRITREELRNMLALICEAMQRAKFQTKARGNVECECQDTAPENLPCSCVLTSFTM